MDNPLDTAGNLAKDAGEVASQGLFGIARFLEQVTGDAVSAAIFAGFLIFALTLVKGAGLSRNSGLYSQAIAKLGLIGIVGYLIFCIIQSLSVTSEVSEIDLIVQGLRGTRASATSGFIGNFISALAEHKWYLAVFVVMAGVGFTLSRIAKNKTDDDNQSIYSAPGSPK